MPDPATEAVRANLLFPHQPRQINKKKIRPCVCCHSHVAGARMRRTFGELQNRLLNYP